MLVNNPLFFGLLGLMVAWVGSYFYSIQHNRRKQSQVANWLGPALNILGPKSSHRRHGTDRLDILIPEGRGNIREAALVLGVQSRQLFKLIISVLRGGRDSLTVLVSLQDGVAAGLEFEVFEARGPLPRPVETNPGGWEVIEFPRQTAYKVAYRTRPGQEMAFRALTLLLDDGFNLRRLSARPTAPDLLLVLNIGLLPQSEAAAMLRVIKNLSDEVARPPKTETRPGLRVSQPERRPSNPARRPAPVPPGEVLPSDGSPPRPGLDAGLTSPNRRSTNGHHPPSDEG